MMLLTTDFHTHILPGIDDGSASVEESLSMLRQLHTQGVDTVVFTPHFYANKTYPDAFLEARKEAMNLLQDALSDELADMKLIMGAEVHFYPGMSRWEQLPELAIGDTGYILVEMPSSKWTESTYRELQSIYHQYGITPILAHIERYFLPFQTQKILNRLSELPVLLQVNSSFIIDKKTRSSALKLLKEKRVHLIGSDCHNMTKRPPRMAETRDILMSNADSIDLSYLPEIADGVLHG